MTTYEPTTKKIVDASLKRNILTFELKNVVFNLAVNHVGFTFMSIHVKDINLNPNTLIVV